MSGRIRIIIILLISVYSHAQNGCLPGTGQYNGTLNNYQTTLLTDNDMFRSPTHSTFIPKKDSISPIASASTWLVGTYVPCPGCGTVTLASCETNRTNGVDSWPGPIDTAQVDSLGATSLCGLFDTFYPVYRSQVDSQKNHLYTTSSLPPNIVNWPANGLPGYNTSYRLAPYVDVNHNNHYDPVNGDYPVTYGDYSIYQINNDVANKHTESGGSLRIGVENHVTSYILNCNSDSSLWNTLFFHYEVINRSSITYPHFLFSIWSDFDLGYKGDDYVGCDTSLNMFYVYNGDSYDEDVTGHKGYHQYLPAFAGVFLNQKLSRFTYYNNTGNVQNGTPQSGYPDEYANLMNGVWKNSTPMTYGASGLTSGNPRTRFLYSGDPVTNTGWTEGNAGNAPGDRRGLGTCGPYTFAPNDTLKIDFAYVFARDYTHPGDSVASISLLRQYIQNIQGYYNTNTTPCGSTFVSGVSLAENPDNKLSVYPNPSNGIVNVSSANKIQEIKVVNMLGQTVYETKLNGSSASLQLNEAGVYFINATIDKKTTTQKVIVLKP